MKELQIHNQGVNIHILHTELNNVAPFVIVPGMVESAESYSQFMESLDRPAIAISLRGRGKSDAPTSGYSFAEQASDIAAVVTYLNLQQYYLIGFSVGAAFALFHSAQVKGKIAGIIVGDYPPIYSAIPSSWINFISSMSDKPITENVASALQKESETLPLPAFIASIDAPVLVIRAEDDSFLDESAITVYQKYVKNIRVVTLPNSTHDLAESADLVQLVNDFAI